MNKVLGRSYTFDDLCIRPCFDNHENSSRLDPDVSTKIFRINKNQYVDIRIPILNAPMDSVISIELADLLIECGTIPVFNRNLSDDNLKEISERYDGYDVIMSIGANIEEAKKMIDSGFNMLLIDVANGHTRRMEKTINEIKRYRSNTLVMAGNVCTGRAYFDLVNWGADSVRVGIGPGAACTTRMVTGIGVPQMTAIMDIAEEAEQLKVPFIADGGIRGSREVCLALAGGANAVMLGKMFALTEESAAEKIYHGCSEEQYHCIEKIKRKTSDIEEQIELLQQAKDDNGDDLFWGRFLSDWWKWLDSEKLAKFRGQASEDYQKDHYGGVREGTVAEGVDFWAPVSGSARDLIRSLIGGLRSCMTYVGSYHLKEFREKTKFYEVTSTYSIESNPRK